MRLRRASALAFIVLGLLPFVAGAQSRDYYGISHEAEILIQSLGDTPVQNLPIPVLLSVEVANLTKNFGDPRDGGLRSHEGLDILAPGGTPVAVPADAVVTSFGDGADSGLYVRTAAAGESYVFMHLSSIASGLTRGQLLKRGDIIGFVGNTGNASGGVTHLHFEIRKNGTATDPYPRLTQTFSNEERAQSLAQALQKGGSAETIVSKNRSTLLAMKTAGVALQQVILDLLNASIPDTPSTVPPPPSSRTATNDSLMLFGETNLQIVALQEFLIKTNTGSAALYLKRSGATGYFGSITKAALIEYQKAMNLSVTGMVDDATYAHIFATVSATSTSSTYSPTTSTTTITTVAYVFTRDLEMGMKGEDVRALQQYLNTHGFVIAQSGDGSPGYETTYFGSLTRAALIRYQSSKGILPTAGYFGPKTRGSFES